MASNSRETTFCELLPNRDEPVSPSLAARNGSQGDAAISLCDTTGRLAESSLSSLDGGIRRLFTALGVTGECRIRLAGDDEVAAAHLKHLGEPGTTDVITFDLLDGLGAATAAVDADLLICIDEAERQAEAARRPVEHEILLYITHGLLHCLGYDDHDEAAAAAMHRKEDEILSAIGIGPVYGSLKATEGGRP